MKKATSVKEFQDMATEKVDLDWCSGCGGEGTLDLVEGPERVGKQTCERCCGTQVEATS